MCHFLIILLERWIIFIKKIKALRKKRGATLDTMAHAIGMSKGNLSRLERGEISISTERLKSIADYFQMPVEELISVNVDAEADLLQLVLDREAMINRMQRATEEFLRAFLEMFARVIDKEEEEKVFKSEGDRMKYIMDNAMESLFDTPGMEQLLNGENTSSDYLLLTPFAEHQHKKALQQVDLFNQKLRIALGLE